MKLFLIVLLILALLLMTFIYLPSYFTGAYKGPVSDHFDGKKFHNLKSTPSKSIFDIIKWRWSSKRPTWPTNVNNMLHSPVALFAAPHTIKVTFINHATVLIQTPKLNILTDPMFSERASPVSWYGPKRVRKPGIELSELPHIDVILISHNHYDHMDILSLKKLEQRFHPTFLVPLGNRDFLMKRDLSHVIEMDWWQKYNIKNAIISFLPAEHWSARWLTDRNRTLWGSYGVEADNKKIYFAGDTGYANHFKTIKVKWGEPDLALLPIGAYLPEWFMHDSHLNPHEAVKAHLDLNAKKSVAIHFGTFQLGDEGFDQPAHGLHSALQALSADQNNKFIILPEGESEVVGVYNE